MIDSGRKLAKTVLDTDGSVLWNALPYELKQAKDTNAIKNKLKSHNKLINDFKFTKENISIFNKKDDYFYF